MDNTRQTWLELDRPVGLYLDEQMQLKDVGVSPFHYWHVLDVLTHLTVFRLEWELAGSVDLSTHKPVS